MSSSKASRWPRWTTTRRAAIGRVAWVSSSRRTTCCRSSPPWRTSSFRSSSRGAIGIGVALGTAVIGFGPLLARLAARNIGRRKSRVLIVVAGLLVGTAIISSSLVVGDTLSYIFLEDVYARLDAIDELVSNSFNGQLFSFAETNFTEIAGDLAANATPIDGIAPALLKVMPVRNVVGNKGNQQITVMGLNASHEGGFGPLTLLDGRTVDTDRLLPAELYANERAAADLNATAGQDLTLFYGTTNQTIVHATVAGIVRDAGKAAYESRAILFMDLRRAQAAFNESGAINLIRVSNRGGIAVEGTYYAVVAAALGALAGLGLGYIMVYFFDRLVPHGDVVVTFHFDPDSVLTAFVAGTALTWITILLASWRVSRLNIVRAIRDLPEPGTRERSRDVLIAGTLVTLGGIVLTTLGFAVDTGIGKIPGPPVLALGLGIAA